MTITNIGQVQGNGVTTITVGAAGVPSGKTIFVAANIRDANLDANPTITDTAGNTYVRDLFGSITTRLCLFRSSNNAALVNGNQIVLGNGGTGTLPWRAITAWYDDTLELASPIDQTVAEVTGSSTTPATGNYTTTVANTQIYGICAVSGPGTDGFTQDADFGSNVTSIGTTGASGGTNKTIRVGDRTRAATETNSYAPTLGTSRAWAIAAIAYKIAQGSVEVTPSARDAAGGTNGPSVVLGGIDITPANANAKADVVNPSVSIGGNIELNTAPAAAKVDVVNPTVTSPGVTIMPDPNSAKGAVNGPTVLLGDTEASPEPAVARVLAVIGQISQGGVIGGGGGYFPWRRRRRF